MPRLLPRKSGAKVTDRSNATAPQFSCQVGATLASVATGLLGLANDDLEAG